MAYTFPSDVEERPIAIDGAGTLGQRIASVYAAGGSDVRIYDLSADQRQAARDYVTDHVEDVQRILGLDPPRTGQVELADDLADAVRGAWMVIEVVPEKLELKREVFGRLDALAESDAILASNSSSLPTSRFIDKVQHPERVLNTPLPAATGAELGGADVLRQDRRRAHRRADEQAPAVWAGAVPGPA